MERQGASPFKYLILYINIGPRGGQGAGGAQDFGLQDWSLPFRANYLLAIRTDGDVIHPDGDTVLENVQVYQWTKIWSHSLRREWDPVGAEMLTVRGDRRTGFVELALNLFHVGSPCAIEAIGWIADTEHHASYAYWPSPSLPGWLLNPLSVSGGSPVPLLPPLPLREPCRRRSPLKPTQQARPCVAESVRCRPAVDWGQPSPVIVFQLSPAASVQARSRAPGSRQRSA